MLPSQCDGKHFTEDIEEATLLEKRSLGSLQKHNERLQKRGRVLALIFTFLAVLLIILQIGTSRTQSISQITEISSLESLRQTLTSKATFSKEHRPFDVAMMVSKPNEQFCKSLFSLLSNGYPAPHLLNYGKGFTYGFGEKIIRFEEYLRSDQATAERIIFIDGHDVWFQLTPNVISSRLKKTLHKTVFGADKKCWPPSPKYCPAMPQSDLPDDIYADYTDKNQAHEYSRPRWVNAGVVIGGKESLLSLYAKALPQVLQNGQRDDQAILSSILLGQASFGQENSTYALDYKSQIIQTMTFSHKDISWEVNPDPQSPSSSPDTSDDLELRLDLSDLQSLSPQGWENSFWKDRPLARNKVSNTIPAILHFNGRKGYLSWWWYHMWFMQDGMREQLLRIFQNSTLPGEAGAWNGEEWLSWNELCPVKSDM